MNLISKILTMLPVVEAGETLLPSRYDDRNAMMVCLIPESTILIFCDKDLHYAGYDTCSPQFYHYRH